MSERIPVLSLSDSIVDQVDSAVGLLNSCQNSFRFDHMPGTRLSNLPARSWYPWHVLEGALCEAKQEQRSRYLIGVLSEAIENNWFSKSAHATNVAFITTKDWQYISELPAVAFIAYEIVENLIECMLVSTDQDENWLEKEVIHLDQTRGCLFDMCALKPDISFKIRTGDICLQCMDALKAKLDIDTIQAVVAILECVRKVALRRSSSGQYSDRSLPEVIDSQFPFPIAYCFRSMRSEFTYSRKFLRMLELYEVSLKYLTFSLIASLGKSAAVPTAMARQLNGLRMPTLGPLHQVSFDLLRLLKTIPQDNFLKDFLEESSLTIVDEVEQVSAHFKVLRNSTRGHGFIEEDPAYQARYEENVTRLDSLMEFLRPLAAYRLVKPVGESERRGGQTRFEAKRMMGSHPLFPIESFVSSEPVDTDCLLYDDRKNRFLSLFPWFLLENCSTCHREMVFIYDKIEGANAVMREYPSNHEQLRSDLRKEVLDKLSRTSDDGPVDISLSE